MEEFKILNENINYEISNLGNMRRKQKDNTYLNLNIKIDKNGYHRLNLQVDKKVKRFTVHVLVAKYFIGERPDGLVIDHIDRNKLNNRVENLRYCTKSENSKNRGKIKRIDVNVLTEEEKKQRDKTLYLKREKYKQNKDIILKRVKKYVEENKETVKEYNKKWRELNRDRLKEKNKQYYQENRDYLLLKEKEKIKDYKKISIQGKERYKKMSKEEKLKKSNYPKVKIERALNCIKYLFKESK